MAAGTATVAVVTTAYTSLGTPTAGMLISPQGPIMIIAATSQPAATAIGHGLDFLAVPFYVPFASEQVWAIALNSNCNVIVTT
jgi:hypothetical protein